MFENHPLIQPIPHDYNTVVPHIYTVKICGMDNRESIKKKMLSKGIQVGYHYQPNHWLSFYQDDQQDSLPGTDAVFPELLSLPLHPEIAKVDVEYIASVLINILTE